jgi:hypothetical protein
MLKLWTPTPFSASFASNLASEVLRVRLNDLKAAFLVLVLVLDPVSFFPSN